MTVMAILYWLLFPAAAIAMLLLRARAVRLERERFIRRYTFSAGLFAKLQEKYPMLDEKDLFLVARALRQYFLIHLRAGNEMIGMPSRVVDDMWHEFILDTRKYTAFCSKAFGRYFHHVPASFAVPGVSIANSNKLTLKLAFLEENINPRLPVRLPLLFAIDDKLKIPNGNTYRLANPAQPGRQGDSACGGVACGGDSCSDASGCCGDGGCGGGCGGD